MKTGNTCPGRVRVRLPDRASMEPGHEDREYPQDGPPVPRHVGASMEPGHEDREYVAVTQSSG